MKFGGENINYKKSVFRNLALISQVGFSVITPIFLSIYFGYLLDGFLKTDYFILIFLVLGVISGGIAAYKLVMSILKKELDEDRELEKKSSCNKTQCSNPKVKSRIYKDKK